MIIAKALLVTWICQRRWGAAAVLLLMLGGVLRPGEATSLRRRHLSFPEDHGEPGLLIIAIEDPKTLPALQHATLEEPAAIPLLRWFIAGFPDDSLLWPGPNYDARLASFAYALQRGLERLGLPANAYTPASMRAGAATAIWVRTFNGELVQRKGRWASARSLRHYLQQAAATLALTRLPLPVRQKCYALADLLPALLQPPLYPALLPAPRRARRAST